MDIPWNEVTWYSRLGALVLFLVIVPILAFVIGEKYQEVKDLQQYRTEQLPSTDLGLRNDISISYATSTVSISSVEFKISAPVAISPNKTIERKINRSIQSRIDAIVIRYQGDFFDAPCKDRLGQTCKTSVNVTSTTTKSSKFNSLSVEIDSFSTSEQMAHPDFEREETITFDLATGEEKSYQELIGTEKTELLTKMSELSRKKLKEIFPPSTFDTEANGSFLEGTAPKDENYKFVLLDEQEMRVFFSYYQIGPRPIGSPEVFITYKELGV